MMEYWSGISQDSISLHSCNNAVQLYYSITSPLLDRGQCFKISKITREVQVVADKKKIMLVGVMQGHSYQRDLLWSSVEYGEHKWSGKS